MTRRKGWDVEFVIDANDFADVQVIAVLVDDRVVNVQEGRVYAILGDYGGADVPIRDSMDYCAVGFRRTEA